MLARCSLIGSFHDVSAWSKPSSSDTLASAGQSRQMTFWCYYNTLNKTTNIYKKVVAPHCFIQILFFWVTDSGEYCMDYIIDITIAPCNDHEEVVSKVPHKKLLEAIGTNHTEKCFSVSTPAEFEKPPLGCSPKNTQ